MKHSPGLMQFALRIELWLAMLVLGMALVVFLSRGLADALAIASIVFVVPQPFLLFAFWRASRGKGK